MSDLMTLELMAEHLRISEVWLLRETKAGNIPCREIEGQFFFNRERVEQAIADGPHRRLGPEGDE